MACQSARERIIALALQGQRRCDIADEVGVPRAQVYNVISEERRKGLDIPRAASGPIEGDHRPRIHVDPAVLAKLRPHADYRKVSVRELAARILATAINENLIYAILDDAEETPNA